MSSYFFDSSALTKYYQVEKGSDQVSSVFQKTNVLFIISRLTITEVISAFTKNMRDGSIDTRKCGSLSRRLFQDFKRGLFEVMPITDPHHVQAEDIISKHGKDRSIRTLDALQLSVAISAKQTLNNLFFVCADKALCEIAEKEQLKVINPLQHESEVI